MNFRQKSIVVVASMFFAIVGMSVPSLAQTAFLTGAVNREAAPNYSVNVSQRARAQAARYDYAGPTRVSVPQRRYKYYAKDNRTYFQRHPMVKSAGIGAGVGAVAGGLTGLIAGRGIVRGAAIGAGTGAGVGVVRSSQMMKRHPIIQDTATGSLAGLGVGWAAGGRHGITAGKGALLGTAGGLGFGLLKNLR